MCRISSLTFNIRISTYLRGQQLQSSGAVTLMNRISKNQGMLLAVLVVLWLGLLMWQFGYSTEQERVPSDSCQADSGHGGQSFSCGRVRLRNLQVHLDRLAAIKGQREATFSTPRNIFASLMPSVSTPVVAPKPPAQNGVAAPKGERKESIWTMGVQASPAGEFPGTLPFEEQVTSERVPEGESSEGEAVVEGPQGPTPEEVARLRIATELNHFRYVGFMAVGGGSQKKRNMAVVDQKRRNARGASR
jgi:hypothetical protein